MKFKSRWVEERVRGMALVVMAILCLRTTATSAPRPPCAPLPETGLIYSERFDGSYQSPAAQIDPNVFIESWSGYALNRPAGITVTPWIVPMIGADGSQQIAPSNGAVRVWYAPSYSGASSGGSGPGSSVALMTLISTNSSSISTWWTLSVTADGNQVQLECATGNGPALCLTGQVALQQGLWTLLTFCYSETNSAIFANDQQIASGSGLPGVPAAVAPFTGLVIGSSLDGQPAMGAFDEFAAFRRTTFPRGHCNPWGLDPAWDIGIYYSDYAPIAALGPIGSTTGASLVSRPSMLSAASAMTLMDSSNTNSFPPTSTNGLTLVSPPPKVGAFFSLQKGAPIPCGVFTNLNYWAVGDPTNGIFVIDDSQIDLSSYAPQQLDVTPQDRTPLDTNGFYLSISSLGNSVLNVTLHGTTNGASYTLLSSEKFSLNPSGLFAAANQSWLVEQDVIGASNQNWTPIQVPTFGRGTLFLRAHEGPDSGPRVLFISITDVSQGTANLLVYSTAAGQNYDVVSSQNVKCPVGEWNSEDTFVGQMNWTPAKVSTGSRPNLFLRARSWVDTTGSGIPDWWLMQYFPTNWNTIDPYALCPSDDGWTILEAYQNGWSPVQWHTPPAPTGLTVSYTGGTDVAAWWDRSPGAVTSYALQRIVSSQTQLFNVGAGTTNFTDSPAPVDDLDPYSPVPSYRVLAHYPGGDSAWSAPVSIFPPDLSSPIAVVRGPQGRLFLAPSGPQGAAAAFRVRVLKDSDTNSPITYPITSEANFLFEDLQEFTPGLPADTFYVDASAVTDGPYALPYDNLPLYGNYSLDVQAIGADGRRGCHNPREVWPLAPSGDKIEERNFPFLDGRRQIQQNLQFLLRSGRAYEHLDDTTMPFCVVAFNGQTSYELLAGTNYVFAGFHFHDDSLLKYVPDPFRPFEENYVYYNFVFSTDNVSADGTALLTGAFPWFDFFYPYDLFGLFGPASVFPTHQAVNTGAGPNFPALLTTNSAQWLLGTGMEDSLGEDLASGSWIIPTDFHNLYGLGLKSVKDLFQTYYPGQTDTNWPANQNFFEMEWAQLSTTNYYFARPGREPLPGETNFQPNAASPLLIVPIGTPMTINCWARQGVANGYASKFAFAEQYFDKACQTDTNGMATSSPAGILSEYGNFFPTMPGAAALLTMPDIDTGLRGTGIVNVIKLQLDVNHDGVMDLSYSGPDNTSPGQPFVFWCNNNYDRWDNDGIFNTQEQDDQQVANCPFWNKPTPDCNYQDQHGNRVIPCTRDLEDFPRLWVCGVNSNLLASLPAGTTVTLSWRDAGNPDLTSPTIDLFAAADADGGIGYQTYETVAAQQTNTLLCPFIGRLRPGQTLQLNASRFTHNWAGDCLIWCGVSNGVGGLALTISQGGTNTLAQTTAYIQIKDIKQMYERWTVGDRQDVPPTNHAYLAQEGDAPGLSPFRYSAPPPVNTPYILHVHGYNMEKWVKDRFAETEYKRLYWQGYQGRFGSFRWPTTYFPSLPPFDDSENQAWNSAPGLLNLLISLNGQYPGNVYLTAHSHGNIVTGEALRLAGASQVVNTYIAMQAAVDSHCYDPTTPTRPVLVDFSTPDRYGQYPTNGASCYFNGVAGAGTYVNFFNTNDYTLSMLVWQLDEYAKPDTGYFYLSLNDTWWQAGFPLNTQLTFPQNTYTIFSYCDQAHAYALGAQQNVGGVFRGSQVILQSVWPPDTSTTDPSRKYSAHVWHSAEFRSDNPSRAGFWSAVLGPSGFNLK